MINNWTSEFDKLLAKQKNTKLQKKYTHLFKEDYMASFTPKEAIIDVSFIEQLGADTSMKVNLYTCTSKQGVEVKLKLYQLNEIPLSDIIPVLENMALRVLKEETYDIVLENDHHVWISDYSLIVPENCQINFEKITDVFQDVFLRAFYNPTLNDGFNKLVLLANLNWEEIRVFRAYTKYLKQIKYRFTQLYIEQVLASNHQITIDFIHLFQLKFDPTKQKNSQKNIAEVKDKIEIALKNVTSLDEDRIFHCFLSLIEATMRTNYFQKDDAGLPKDYLSFKFASQMIPDIPLPMPLYEIFVFSPRFEGIHLRSSKVARGGIRWSDRLEDFRTEILGLMKTQTVKNVMIVPSGAKGGFVLKSIPANAIREIISKEVSTCYTFFIGGLLELTDNLINDKIIKPKNTVCYDEDDYYLVVAADKGTATFSDLANSISSSHDFWLSDAFASGGSSGYDHKKMGITARGAWESVKRHFRDLNINLEETNITVVGIGDMSGDVFGNGLLYSNKIKLVAAFDHRHIFVDPDPKPEISFKERKRLFNLPISSWEDYNPKLISKGGAVFKRSQKTVMISPEMKKIFDIQENQLEPDNLVRAILKSKVDLFWNGGIGTFVKASTESQADARDKTNDYIRVNANELRCSVVGEGGNLGFTQLARIEYALNGGLINSDFIDNSAGVDCSDQEVNIKILLNNEISKGRLTETKRNQLLSSMTDEVAQIVLKDNYTQALALSYASAYTIQELSLYLLAIKELEHNAGLVRSLEYLPDDKTILDRKASQQGLTRPELAVLLAYTKIYIKKEILASDIPSDTYFNSILVKSFAVPLQKSYSKPIMTHRLRREIIATELSNDLVNDMGVTFIFRMQTETDATIPEIIRAFTVVSKVFEYSELKRLIDSVGYKIPLNAQYEILEHLKHHIAICTRWFLRENRMKNGIVSTIEHFYEPVKSLFDVIPKFMVGATKSYLATLTTQFADAGLPHHFVQRIAGSRAMYNALNIIEVSSKYKYDLVKTTELYLSVGAFFNLVWFRDQLVLNTLEGFWNTLARVNLRDKLDMLQKTLTIIILSSYKTEKKVEQMITLWAQENKRIIQRWKNLQEKLHESSNVDFNIYFVALNELMSLLPIM